MNEVVTGAVQIALGGFILLMGVPLAWRSLWDKKVRDEILSAPHLRKPTAFHKMMFAAMGIALLVFAMMLVQSGLSHLIG